MIQIYYRPSLMDKDELNAAKKYFDCIPLLSSIKENSFVIPRYSIYPFISDQLNEIKSRNASCITNYKQHNYIADLENYYQDLKGMTPETWFRLQDVPEEGSFVLKGETNSRKADWNRSMFALTKKDASNVYSELCNDSLIGEQKICIRRYAPLVNYGISIGGAPISKEYRFFVAFGQIIAGGFYWQNHLDDIDFVPNIDEVPKEFLEKVIQKVNRQSNFYVIDVAQTQSSEWIVIELNAGVSSGLSCCDPYELYKNLYESCSKNTFN